MKIVIPGGTGQVGTILARAFHARGDEVVVLSRHPAPAPWRIVPWDATTRGPWFAEIDGADIVINLAGRSVNCRYTPANRSAILQSRVDSTRILGEAISTASRPPRVWLQSSTATIYAHRYDAPNDEATGIIGGADADAECRLHARIASRVGHANWTSSDGVDVGSRRPISADGNGAGAQESPRGAGGLASRRIRVQLPAVGVGRCGVVHAVAKGPCRCSVFTPVDMMHTSSRGLTVGPTSTSHVCVRQRSMVSASRRCLMSVTGLLLLMGCGMRPNGAPPRNVTLRGPTDPSSCGAVDGSYQPNGDVMDAFVLRGTFGRSLGLVSVDSVSIRGTPASSILLTAAHGEARDTVRLQQGADYTCDGGWLVMTAQLYNQELPDELVQVRDDGRANEFVFALAGDTRGRLIGRVTHESYATVTVWCGDGCRGFRVPFSRRFRRTFYTWEKPGEGSAESGEGSAESNEDSRRTERLLDEEYMRENGTPRPRPQR